MKQIFIALFILLLSIVPHSCFSKCKSSSIREEVMTEGMSIKAQTEFGLFEIYAGKGCKRTLKWENESYTIDLIPRKERWYGKLGLYHPQMRPPHKNVVHMIAEEYQINFNSELEAIKSMNPEEEIYNDQGLCIHFSKRDGPGGKGNIFIMAIISQILINGEKPTKLKGSQNNRITTTTNT